MSYSMILAWREFLKMSEGSVDYSIGNGKLRRSQPEPPVVFRNSKGEIVPNEKTLRDEFAIAALIGISAHINGPRREYGEATTKAHARWAYETADAIMAERLK